MSDTVVPVGWTPRTASSRPCFADRIGWPLVAAWLAVVALIVNFVLIFWVSSMPLNMYIAQPLLWGSVGALALWTLGGDRKLPADRWLIAGAVMVGLFQVVLLFLAGLLAGFGNSPYSREPIYVALNLWFVAVRLAGLEMARWQLMQTVGRRRVLVGGALVWLLLTLASLPLRAFTNLPASAEAVDFLGGTVVPVAGQNLLATYLVVAGGPLASMAYLGTLLLFEWVPPVLPKLPWVLAVFLGMAVPALGLVVVRDLREWRTPVREAEQEEPSGSGLSTLWVAVAALVVFLIWFNSGAFGVRPALIAGQSMEPTMGLGDVAITRQVPTSEIQVGDVVRFQQGGISVVHRVQEIRVERGQTLFITKGDNNSAADPLVPASWIEGKMVAMIPKVGWIGVAVKSLFGLVR